MNAKKNSVKKDLPLVVRLLPLPGRVSCILQQFIHEASPTFSTQSTLHTLTHTHKQKITVLLAVTIIVTCIIENGFMITVFFTLV